MHPGSRLLTAVALALLAAPAAAQESPRLRDDVRALEGHVRKLIEDAEPSVVAVVVSHLKYKGPAPDWTTGRLGRHIPEPRPDRFRPFNPVSPAEARLDLSDPQYAGDHQFGSGLVLDAAARLVLTNYHLIDGATKVYVKAAGGKGSYADVHAADARSDLAVLRLLDPVPGTAAVRLAPVRVHDGPGGEKATVYRGLGVIALGHPVAAGLADGQASASWGLLSNVRRRAAGPDREEARYRAGNAKPLYQYGTLLQTDARITLGCSGGGLFDLDGNLIGMTAPLAAVTGSETAGGFAVPFDQNTVRIVKTLQQGREVEYGFLGVGIGDPLPRPPFGLPINNISPGSPAARAGLFGLERGGESSGDVILAVDGQPIRTADDLFLSVGAALAGSKVRLRLARGGRERTEGVVLAKHHNPLPWLASNRPPPVFGLRVDYVSTLSGMAAVAAAPVLPQAEEGVLVRELEPNSPAAAKFGDKGGNVGARWVVVAVDGRPVDSPDEFYAATRGKAAVRLRVRDLDPNGRERDIELP